MKRFLLFSGDFYYPGGGWEDFIGTFDTLKEAQEAGRRSIQQWYQIVDTKTMKVL